MDQGISGGLFRRTSLIKGLSLIKLVFILML